MTYSTLVLATVFYLTPDNTEISGDLHKSKFELMARTVAMDTDERQAPKGQGERLSFRRIVSYGCGGHGTTQTNCDGLVTSAELVCEGDFFMRPRMVNTYDENGAPLTSTFIAGDCSTNPNPPDQAPLVVTAYDFQQLPLRGSGITLAPERDSYFVNLPIYTSTSDEPQLLTTTMLGTPVSVKATPTSYTWTFSDSTPPQKSTEATTHHTYTTPATLTVSLTTTWAGQFTTNNGATWQPINGTATTTNTSDPIIITESVPRLTNN